jgi:hypothetical protein
MKNMKKFYILLTAVFLLLLPCDNVMAQALYKASVGGMISPIPPVGGFSFKTFFTNKIAFQTDIFFKTMLTGTVKEGYALYSSCVINPDLLYQNKIKEMENSYLFWLAGGGVSFGTTMVGDIKFGTNVMMGIELVFKKNPLAIQIDIRPGYGMLFTFKEEFNNLFLPSNKNPWHHFDWLIGCTFRYTLKKKTE